MPKTTLPFVRITPSLLREIGVAEDRAQRFATPISQTMGQYKVIGPNKQAHFLGQILTESGMLRYTEEIWGPTEAQRGYDTREEDLGNTPERDGDGYKYRGRGLIQVTGKRNYERFDEHLKRHHGMSYNLVEDPAPVAEAPLNCICAGWYWGSHGLNAIADRGAGERAITRVTEIINGGHNHISKRIKLTQSAHDVLWQHLKLLVTEKVPVFSPETADLEVKVKALRIEYPKPGPYRGR